MSRRVDRRLNNKTNYMTNSRVYNAPYCAAKNKTDNARFDKVNEISYRKASLKAKSYDRHSAAVTGFRVTKQIKKNEINIFEKLSKKNEKKDLSDSCILVGGKIFVGINGIVMFWGIIDYAIGILVTTGFAGFWGSFSWVEFMEMMKLCVATGSAVWSVNVIVYAVGKLIFMVCSAISLVIKKTVRGIKGAIKATVSAIKGAITESKLIKEFAEAYIYYKAYKKARILKAEMTEREIEKIFK